MDTKAFYDIPATIARWPSGAGYTIELTLSQARLLAARLLESDRERWIPLAENLAIEIRSDDKEA